MNRLSRERSPYLRQHQDNPVDWYPWGEEALQRARAEDKPILLSVGYSACHWCHVMAHESFEDPSTAEVMNAHFINIKLDREERPDLDGLYQGVVQLMGRGGGWPLTVFLRPDLTPFFGGTYFPPQERYGMPGFKSLLAALSDAWKNRRADIDEQSGRMREGLSQLATYGLTSSAEAVTVEDVISAGQKLGSNVDRIWGGFGGAPKFPNPMNVAMLLRAYRRTRDESLLSAALLTLEQMAHGGIYDQLGGGFSRYSVDGQWRVPHFEKMLYDNAQLLHLYAEAEQLAPRALWRQVASETVEWLKREMTSPEGGFYAAQDADSEGEEGKFFVWKEAEVDSLLPAGDAAIFKAHFGVTARGNFEEHTNILHVEEPVDRLAQRLGRPVEEVSESLQRSGGALLSARFLRVAPGRDDKILTGWNGLMIRGLAFASRVFREPSWAELASRAARLMVEEMWDGKRLLRSFQDGTAKIEGFLEDYGNLAAGLCTLYQTTFEPRWLEVAEALESAARHQFWDAEKHAYWVAPKGTPDLLLPTYALFDNATPSGASSLTEAQLALAALTGRNELLEHAGTYLRKQRGNMVENPMGFGHLLLAADTFTDGAPGLALVGERKRAQPFLDVLASRYAPTIAAAYADGEPPKVLAHLMLGRESKDGSPAAYLCRNFSCEAPLFSAEALRERLGR